MKVTQNVPERWTVEAEQGWQRLTEEVDGDSYAEYVEDGGLRPFESWRERELTELEQAALSSRHDSTTAELFVRPAGAVDVWVPPHLPFDPRRFVDGEL